MILLLTKYISCDSVSGSLEKKILKPPPSLSQLRLKTPEAWQIWTPGAWMAGFMKGTTRHCSNINLYLRTLKTHHPD